MTRKLTLTRSTARTWRAPFSQCRRLLCTPSSLRMMPGSWPRCRTSFQPAPPTHQHGRRCVSTRLVLATNRNTEPGGRGNPRAPRALERRQQQHAESAGVCRARWDRRGKPPVEPSRDRPYGAAFTDIGGFAEPIAGSAEPGRAAIRRDAVRKASGPSALKSSASFYAIINKAHHRLAEVTPYDAGEVDKAFEEVESLLRGCAASYARFMGRLTHEKIELTAAARCSSAAVTGKTGGRRHSSSGHAFCAKQREQPRGRGR